MTMVNMMMNPYRSCRLLLVLLCCLNSGGRVATTTATALGETAAAPIRLLPMRLPQEAMMPQPWQEENQEQQQQQQEQQELVVERQLQQQADKNQQQQQPFYNIDDEEALSFDGDVSFIQQLALQKAAAAAATTTTTGGASGVQSGSSSTTNNIGQAAGAGASSGSSGSVVYPSSCESSTTSSGSSSAAKPDVPQQLQQHHLEVLTWFYSVEFKTPSAADAEAAGTASIAAAAAAPAVQQQSYHQHDDHAVRTLQKEGGGGGGGAAFTLSASPPFTTPIAATTTTTASAELQQRSLLAKVEQVLQLRLANLILVCASVDAEFAEIVGEVSLPMDDVSEEQSCIQENPTTTCINYDGKMNLFLSNGEKAEDAVYWGRKNVQAVLQDPTFLTDVGLGLVKITYLGPDPVKPDGGSGNTLPKDDPSSVNSEEFEPSSTLGTASIALMAVGGAVIMVFVMSVFVWRRNQDAVSMQHSIFVDAATATQGGGGVSGASSGASPVLSSNLTISDGSGDHGIEVYDRNNSNHDHLVNNHDLLDDDSVGDQPTSPFSEMLPMSYRFNDNMSIMSGRDSGLSAVAEAAESSEEQVSDTSIAVSDSGFTNDAVGMSDDSSMLSLEMPHSLHNINKQQHQQHHGATMVGTSTTTMAGAGGGSGRLLVQEGHEMESPAPLGARKRHENAITATLTEMANSNMTRSREVSSDDDDVFSDMTCSALDSAKQGTGHYSSSTASMMQPKNLLAQAAFAEGGGAVDSSMVEDENMLFV